jgi:hypothetical protein
MELERVIGDVVEVRRGYRCLVVLSSICARGSCALIGEITVDRRHSQRGNQ